MNEEILFTLIVCTAASFAGAFIQRVSGFGYGIFVMMFFPLVLAYGQATALSGCISLISASFVAFNLRKNIQWKQVFLPLIAYALTNYFSVRFVGDADTGLLTRLLGGALLLLSVYFFFFSKKIHIKATPVAALAAGGLSGNHSMLFCPVQRGGNGDPSGKRTGYGAGIVADHSRGDRGTSRKPRRKKGLRKAFTRPSEKGRLRLHGGQRRNLPDQGIKLRAERTTSLPDFCRKIQFVSGVGSGSRLLRSPSKAQISHQAKPRITYKIVSSSCRKITP